MFAKRRSTRFRRAIVELGYVRDTSAANLARRRVYNLVFVLPETNNEFIVALDSQIAEQAAKLAHDRTTLRTRTVAPFDPQRSLRSSIGLTRPKPTVSRYSAPKRLPCAMR